REVLRDRPAPGNAEHVGLAIAELGQQPGHQAAQAGETVRPGGQRGTADPGNVEADDAERGIKLVDERLQQLQAGADAVDQQQGHAPAGPGPDRDAQRLAIDHDAAYRRGSRAARTRVARTGAARTGAAVGAAPEADRHRAATGPGRTGR